MTPRATTIVASSITGPETGTTRAPRMAKYFGSPPCPRGTVGAISNKIAAISPASAKEPVRSNQERMPTPFVRKKSDDKRSVEWTDEATVKFAARQEARAKIKSEFSLLSANVLGFFLFSEQSAQRINCVGGTLRTGLPDLCQRSAGAAQLRFHHVGRNAADIWNKFRVRSSSLNLKRNCRAAFAAAA